MDGLVSASWLIGSYIIAGGLMYFVINFMTKGFIGQYLKVKITRGKLTLVKCYDVTDTYYKAGNIDTRKNLIIKDRLKKIHTFSKMDRSYLNRELGLNLIEVDLVKGLVIKKDFSGTTGFDLTMLDEFVNRALMLPKLKKNEIWENIQKIILIGIILGVGVIIYLQVSSPEPVCSVPALAGVNI